MHYSITTDEDTSCVDGDVRLQDGVSSSNGRVEFCQYRTWGTVCNEGWDDNDARVVCGQLGYSNPEGINDIPKTLCLLNTFIRCKHSGRI